MLCRHKNISVYFLEAAPRFLFGKIKEARLQFGGGAELLIQTVKFEAH